MKQMCHLEGFGVTAPVRPDFFSKQCRAVLRLDEYEDRVDHVDVDSEDGTSQVVGGSSACAVVLSDAGTLGRLAQKETRVLWTSDLDPVEAWLALSSAMAGMPEMPEDVAAIITRAAAAVRNA